MRTALKRELFAVNDLPRIQLGRCNGAIARRGYIRIQPGYAIAFRDRRQIVDPVVPRYINAGMLPRFGNLNASVDDIG